LKHSKYWLVVLGVTLLLVLAGAVLPDLRTLPREAVYPFEHVVSWVSRHLLVPLNSVWQRADLGARNRALAEAVDRLRLDVARLQPVVEENRLLRARLALPPPPSYRLVAAPALSRGGSAGWKQVLRVGKGSLDGVAAGDPVMVADALVGRVESVSPHTADVLLLCDMNCRIACELDPPPAGLAAVRGVLCGGGDRPAGEEPLQFRYVMDPLRLRFLKRDVEVAPHTRVVTSGQGGVFPRGLLVGYVLESSVDTAGLYRESAVMPAADLGDIPLVFVLVRAPGGAS
jgi:rod shape-determining protein MreC